jgi:ribosomal protein S12 methylthiotransferase accessory factor
VGASGSELFAPPTSNGLAGGRNITAAVLAGLYELVERDAFVIAWLTRRPSRRIDVSSSAGLAADVERYYRRRGVETVAFDLTTDIGIPVVMCVAFDRSGSRPAATVGLGCSFDRSNALDRAVMEVVQIRSASVPRYRALPSVPPISRYADIQTLEEHAAFAAEPDHLDEFDFLDAQAAVEVDVAEHGGRSVEAELADCTQRLEAAGCTVAFVDLTLPDIEPFGITIVRALATGLQPIHFGFGGERLGGRRLYTVPRLLGYSDRNLTEADLNRCPHPLA